MTYDSIKALLVDHDGKLSSVNGMMGELQIETVPGAGLLVNVKRTCPQLV